MSKQTKPETVLVGGPSPFEVGLHTEVVVVSDEMRTKTFVVAILGSEKQRYVRVAHRVMEFSCRDGIERQRNFMTIRLERYDAATEAKFAAEKAEKALRERLVARLSALPWKDVVEKQRWIAERILEVADAVAGDNHVPYRFVEDEEPDMSR